MIPGRNNDFIVKERNRWLERFAGKKRSLPKKKLKMHWLSR
jgi:hypothetical protein